MIHALIRNGMGDPDLGTGAEEDDFLYWSNFYLLQNGIVDVGDCLVSQRGAGANMSVDVAKGRVFVPNANYVANTDGETRSWPMMNDAIVNVPIAANSSGQPRIDIIIFKMNTGTAPDDEASNVGEITVVQGAPAGSPVAPATPSNSYKLAEVDVANGATSIITGNLTDTRDIAYMNLNKGSVAYGTGLHFLDSNGDPTNYLYMKATDHFALHIGVASKSFLIENSAGSNVFEVNTDAAYKYAGALDGYKFRAFSAGNDKYLDSFHDDTNGIIQSSSGSVYARSTTGILGTISPDGTKSMKIQHDNTNGELAVTSGALTVSANPVYFATTIFGNGDAAYDLGSNATRWRTVYAQTGTINTSDERDKQDIEDSDLGLDFVLAVQPKKYRWKENPDWGTYYGFIAQQVLEALDGRDFAGIENASQESTPDDPDNESDRYGLSYTDLIAPLYKAVQELAGRVAALEK